MTLRAKFALALALLSGVSAIAVAIIGYNATADRLHSEVDNTLQSYVQRFSDPDGNLARALCTPLRNVPPGPSSASNDFAAEFRGLPGVAVQCVSSSGAILNEIGPQGAPVPSTGDEQKDKPFALDADDQSFRVVTIQAPNGDIIRISRNLDETNAVLRSVRNRYIALGITVPALATLIGLFIARRTTRPIASLTRGAEEIAATGNLDVVLPEAGSDEVGRLAGAFAGMIGALRQSKEQQQQLVQDASHELRTPLSSLRTNIDTLRRYKQLPDIERDHVLSDLDSEFRELTTLVDELIALAADTHDDEAMQLVNLVAVVETVAERSSRRSGHDVNVTGTSEDVEAKPQQLSRAITNLVENAIKFGGDGTPVDIEISDHQVSVRDHGSGIADEDMPLLFDRFYRSAASRSKPGSGLGLAIVKQIMADSGGTATAANHPAGGAIFTLTFRKGASSS